MCLGVDHEKSTDEAPGGVPTLGKQISHGDPTPCGTGGKPEPGRRREARYEGICPAQGSLTARSVRHQAARRMPPHSMPPIRFTTLNVDGRVDRRAGRIVRKAAGVARVRLGMSAAGERFVRGSKRRLKGAPIRTGNTDASHETDTGIPKIGGQGGQRLLPCFACRGYPQETRPDRRVGSK